jgi:hypothetical protein
LPARVLIEESQCCNIHCCNAAMSEMRAEAHFIAIAGCWAEMRECANGTARSAILLALGKLHQPVVLGCDFLHAFF